MNQVMDALATSPERTSSGNGAMHRADPTRTLAKDSTTLKNYLDASKDRLATVIPKHLNPEKLMRVALVAVSRSKNLQECTIASILQCVMTGAQLGLDCSGVLGSAYMVPFGKEAVFIPGYRGLIDLARRTGEIEDISANVVYADDSFDFELGAQPRLIHRPNLQVERKDDHIVAAYMVAFLKGNSRPHIEVMPRADIDKVRKSSRASGNGPWRDWFSEMCRKSVVRRGIKYLPMSVEMAEAVQLDDQATERTEVLSASTESGRTEALLKKITSRPVSDNQIFTPTDEAFAEAAQGQSFDPNTGELDSTTGGDADADADAASGVQSTKPLKFQNFEGFRLAMMGAAMDLNVPESILNDQISKAVLAAGAKGKEAKIKVETLREWHAAFVAGKEPFARGQ